MIHRQTQNMLQNYLVDAFILRKCENIVTIDEVWPYLNPGNEQII